MNRDNTLTLAVAAATFVNPAIGKAHVVKTSRTNELHKNIFCINSEVKYQQISVSASTSYNIVKQYINDIFHYTSADNILEKEIESRLDVITRLTQNWNGYGAAVPSDNVQLNLRSFLALIPNRALIELKAHKILPTPYGTVIVEWEQNKQLISVEVGENALAFFSEFEDGINPEIDEYIFSRREIPVELSMSFQKLFA